MSSLWAQFWAARHPPADPVHISYKDKAVLVTGTFTWLQISRADYVLTLINGSQVQTRAWATRLR